MTFQPYPHQTRTVEAVRTAAAEGHRRILVVSPTGSGKMAMAAMILASAAMKGFSGCFVADQRELVSQCETELRRMGQEWGTLLSGVDNHSPMAPLQVIAKDTLWARAFRRKRVAMPGAHVLCFDEADRSVSRTWRAVADYYTTSFIIGFTATPCRTDGRGLGPPTGYYTKLIVGATYEELLALKRLVPARIVAPRTPDLKGIKVSKGDYAKGELEKRMNQDVLVGNILDDYKKWGEDRVAIVFASGINHSIHIRNEFRRAGIPAEHLDGKTDKSEREDIMGALREGRIVLCNYGVATVGVDVPIAKCGIIARPTKSLRLWRQMCGRFARPYPGYSDYLIIDHSASWERHGFPDVDIPWSLDAKEKIGERIEKEKKKKERAELEPYKCKECHEVYRGPRCPKCGYRPERKPKSVKMEKGDLHEVDRSKITQVDKQKKWDECLGWAIGTGKKVGAAAHRFRQETGTWPNNKIAKVPRGKKQWNMSAKEFYQEHVCEQ